MEDLVFIYEFSKLSKADLINIARNMVFDCMGFKPKLKDIHLLESGDGYFFFGLGTVSLCYLRQSGLGTVCLYPSWDGIDGCKLYYDYHPHIY